MLNEIESPPATYVWLLLFSNNNLRSKYMLQSANVVDKKWPAPWCNEWNINLK